MVLQILEELRDDDEALAACYLVSKAFLPLSRDSLYRRVLSDAIRLFLRPVTEHMRQNSRLLNPHLAQFPNGSC